MTSPIPSRFQRAILHRKVLAWYSRYGRVLPWRNISNPYKILVSEVMLQQTQVNRVLVKYPEFLRRFPTLGKLGDAPRSAVVIAWKGMGYNRRAVHLHRVAKTIHQQNNGRFPHTYDEMVQLPGIGRYTANAILSSAFRKDTPVVDVNIRRVLSRLLWPMKKTTALKSEREIWKAAEVLLPAGRSYRWNQALMDLGATICTARTPRCAGCPVNGICSSFGRIKIVKPPIPRHEPAKDGVPNRIYRGRIVETLRHHHGRRRLSPDDIGRTVHPRYSIEHRPWLDSLLSGLQKDGLIVRAKGKRWNDQRIALA